MDIATLISWIALATAVVTLGADHWRRRRQATLDAYIDTVGRRMDLYRAEKAVIAGELDADGNLTREASYALAKDHEAEGRDEVRDYLASWEHLAAGVRFWVYENRVLKKLAQRRIATIYERHSAYIYFVRRIDETPNAYEHLEHLALKYGARGPDPELDNWYRNHE
jgi:hypothetical protein